jgi:hypothetical protein
MRDTIDMAREAGIIDFRDAFSEEHVQAVLQDLKAFEILVRADERQQTVEANAREIARLTELCYDYLGQLTALRAAKQMQEQIDSLKEKNT